MSSPLFVSSPPPNLRPLDKDDGLPGIVAPTMPHYVQSTVALTASRATLCRFVPSRNMTITKIAFSVNANAGANDAIDVGIYSAGLQRIVSSGSTAGLLNGTTGPQVVTIASTPITAGTVYYAGFAVGTFGGSAGNLVATNLVALWGQMFGTGAPNELTLFKASSFPLPDDMSAASGSLTAAPMLALRES